VNDTLGGSSSFPVVAIGASAGGLAPTSELLRELGGEPGLALVIIHHLDPTHASGLVDILSRSTPLPVTAATDGLCVEKNHVYVIPPNAGLLVAGGVLRLVPRSDEGGVHLPINRFFESLALDRDGLAGGVVLSGSGFDGTDGIKAIKREGGITLAQDATAEYGSMPESAIATGCVDFILPPVGLARELRRLGAYTPALRARPPSGTDGRDYLQILALMRRASGVDFASYKPTTIRRRMERRLFFRGLSDLSAYLELLQRDPAEVTALCEEALIHVTSFFRDPEVFEALCTLVFPKLCENRAENAPIRIWVPGCSTGEEVYSLAICLREFLRTARRELPIKIFGTDLSAAVVDKARSGRFSASIASEVSEGRLQGFFSKSEQGYQIRRDLRDVCVFAQHDVARDPPFAAMDLISCRNLMIYLGPELQDRVLGLLHYALNEPGFLLLGNAETVRAFPGFVVVDGKHKLYARTSAAPRQSFDFTTPHPPRDRSLPGPAVASLLEAGAGARSPGQSDVQREADRLVLAKFAPAGVVVNDDLVVIQFRGKTGAFLEHAPGAASLDLLHTAREELRLPLRRAIDHARSTDGTARETDIALYAEEKRRSVAIEVVPFWVQAARQRFFVVLFEDVTPAQTGAEGRVMPAEAAAPAPENALGQELASTRQYLESVIEQLEATNEELKAANEEVVSSNEELRSTNEELQSAKEELQATNEELRTVNDEMRDRNVEATRLSDDLTNVLTSVEIPILMLGRDLRLRRFTPAAAKLFGLLASDLGRALNEVPRIIAVAPALVATVPEVLEHLRPIESTIQDASGRHFALSVRTYLTLDGRVDGTVVTARDIDAQTRSAERVEAARAYAQAVIDTVRDGLVVLDRELRITSANKAFLHTFRLACEQVLGRGLDELGRPELAGPSLSKLLGGMGVDEIVEGFRVQQNDGAGGPRAFMVNARRIEQTELLLVAYEDVTLAEHARAAIEFRDVLAGAAEGVLMVDTAGRVRFVNRSAAAIFGYESEELVGHPVDLLLPEPLRELHARERASYLAAPSPRIMGRSREVVGRRKDGTELPVEVTLSTVAQLGGAVVVAFVTDITERRIAEKKILAYQDELRRMSFDAAVTEERERRRIATALHDRMGQALALTQIKLTSIRDELAGDARSAVDGAVELLSQAIADARTLIFDLSPPILYDLGLEEALGWLAEDLQKRHGIKIEVVNDGAIKPLDDAAKVIVFRAVRELLMNVLKHAKTLEAKVTVTRSDGQCRIDVEDRGAGFDPEGAREPGSVGFGLLSARAQIARLGGRLEIQSAPGRGTLATVQVPLQVSDARPAPSAQSAPPDPAAPSSVGEIS
jgi:two-component system CheB/CheR fusion protein